MTPHATVMLSDNTGPKGSQILNDGAVLPHKPIKAALFEHIKTSMPMKQVLRPLLAAIALSMLAGPLHAACFADYRARMDNPLRLHYGVMEVPQSACSVGAASRVVARRLAAQGWTLVNVGSVFDERGLASRRSDAGQYFLRF